MGIEKTEKDSAREKLLSLEKEGIYIFHGSAIPDIKELEPRQAYTYPGGSKTEDEIPAVAATPFSEIAIFRALIKGRSGFGNNGSNLHFEASQKALDEARERIGYVYVLDKENFQPKDGSVMGMDWRNKNRTKPIDMIEVGFEDLPEEIKIILEGQ